MTYVKNDSCDYLKSYGRQNLQGLQGVRLRLFLEYLGGYCEEKGLLFLLFSVDRSLYIDGFMHLTLGSYALQ